MKRSYEGPGGPEDARKVFVYGLPFEADWQQLKNHFRSAGPVVFAGLIKNKETGTSKGCGIVEFETVEQSLRAIDMFNNSEMMGRSIFVRQHIQDKEDRVGDKIIPPAKKMLGASGFGGGMGYGSMGMGQNMMSMGMVPNMMAQNQNIMAQNMGYGGMGYGGMMGGVMNPSTGMVDQSGMAAQNMMAQSMGYGGMGMDQSGMMGGAGMMGTPGMMGTSGMMMNPGMMGTTGMMGAGMMGGGMMGGAGMMGGRIMGTGPGTGVPGRRLFVSNLDYTTTWQQVKDHFKKCGTVLYCTILKDKATEKSKGCGVVEFDSPVDAQNALMMLHNSMLGGRSIFVKFDDKDGMPLPGMTGGVVGGRSMGMGGLSMGGGSAMSMGGGSALSAAARSGCQICIHGLPFAWGIAQVTEFMQPCGSVMNVRMPTDDLGRSRGWGIVLFSSTMEAQQAIQTFDKAELEGRTLHVKLDEKAK